MPSHSLNPQLYPDGHGVVTDPLGARHNARPVPQPMHLASIEKEESVRRAIEYVMSKQNVPYPVAAKQVHDKGEKFFLDQRDADANAAAAAAEAPAPSPLRPGEEVIDVEATPLKPKIVATGGKK